MDGQATGAAHLSIELPKAEEDLCRRYGRGKVLAALAESLLVLALLVGLTLSGTAAHLLRLLTSPGTPAWLGHLAYLALLAAAIRLALLPLHFLNEYWLERRFGLCRQGAGAWLWEWLCRSLVLGAAGLALLFPVAETLRWGPGPALVWCGLFLVLRPFFFDRVYAPLLGHFYPIRFLRHESFTLPGIGKVTLPVYQVKVSHKTRRANAGIRLRGRKTAIYVTDTLIDAFTDGEERVVMAHEFGHLYDQLHLEERTRAGVAQAHRKLMLGSAQLLAGVLSLGLLHFLAPALHLAGAHDPAALPLLTAMTLILAHAISPLLCAEARRDERDADEYALAVTGDVQNYVSVMRKLRRINLEEVTSNPVSRLLFDTHPSYSERLDLALQYRRRIQRPRKARAWRGWRHVQRHGRR